STRIQGPLKNLGHRVAPGEHPQRTRNPTEWSATDIVADVPPRPAGRHARRGSPFSGHVDAGRWVTYPAVCDRAVVAPTSSMALQRHPHEQVVRQRADVVDPSWPAHACGSATETARGVRPFNTGCTVSSSKIDVRLRQDVHRLIQTWHEEYGLPRGGNGRGTGSISSRTNATRTPFKS